jgi:hypothetical protein
MKNKILIFIVLLLFSVPLLVFSEKIDEESLYGYFAGKYLLIGKKVDSDETYSGKIEILNKGKYIEVKRIINKVEVKGIGKIEYLVYENIPVLKIRFKEKGVEYECEFTWSSDFDNYPRISGYVEIKGKETDNPGLEVLFIIHEE